MAHDLSRLFDLSIGLGKMLQEHNVAERLLAETRASLALVTKSLSAEAQLIRFQFPDLQVQNQFQNFKYLLRSQSPDKT